MLVKRANAWAINRKDKPSLVYGHVQQLNHDFAFEKARLIGQRKDDQTSARKGLTDESEVLKFLQNGTLVGLLPVPHPILIRKYQSNFGTAVWFRTYIWGVIYLRNLDPPIWYDTNVRLFEVQPI
ncbi:unnamed protein product [Dibothriocephalus latus]|uniref:Uncharacterized protein n=1 Tax=Dibothriocephalus latus TaxID=60516 RepID=A0A3P7LLN0_DIBLA|nr:unnamed protein product [Dibothriocephalus latus]